MVSRSLQANLLHPAIERGPTDAERFGRLRCIAVGLGQSASQYSSLGIVKRWRAFALVAEDFSSAAAPGQAGIGEFEAIACGVSGADDQIISVDSEQGRVAAGEVRVDDAVPLEMLPKDAAFDPARSILNDFLDQRAHRCSVIVAAIGNVERANQSARRVSDWSIHTTDADVAAGEVLVAVNRNRASFYEAGSDPIGTFAAFAPHTARGQPDLVEHLAIAGSAARFEYDSVIV